MEARRQELLSEEGGYWSRRMAAEQAAAEQLAAAQQALIEVRGCLCSRAASDAACYVDCSCWSGCSWNR
jgi:hypothetical protein